jgi:hypothetical protein
VFETEIQALHTKMRERKRQIQISTEQDMSKVNYKSQKMLFGINVEDITR